MLKLWNDQSGAIISSELVLVLTVGVLALVVGVSQLATALTGELSDLASSFGAFDQSYVVGGHAGCCASTTQSANDDDADRCDCAPIDSCDKNIITDVKCE